MKFFFGVRSIKCEWFGIVFVFHLLKKKIMKRILVTFALFYTILSSGQELIGKVWNSNHIFGENPKENNLYILTKPYDPEGDWGNHIELSTDGRFHSWYSAKCGNDCFTDSYGTYEKVNVFYIRFHLSKITNSCDVKTQKKKETSLYYIHKVSEREIYLIKSTGDLIKDQQKAVNSKQ